MTFINKANIPLIPSTEPVSLSVVEFCTHRRHYPLKQARTDKETFRLKIFYHYFVVFRLPCYFGSIASFLNVAARKDCHRFRGTQQQSSENICSEDDLTSRIFGTFVVKFLACLPLLGFSNIYKMV